MARKRTAVEWIVRLGKRHFMDRKERTCLVSAKTRGGAMHKARGLLQPSVQPTSDHEGGWKDAQVDLLTN